MARPGRPGRASHDPLDREVAVPELDHAVAGSWVDRWDVQQTSGYMPDREERFTALIDAVEAEAGRPDPLVLDLGSGPGSLAVRLLDRMPAATVLAIDADPLLLALGRAAYQQRAGLGFIDLDLRSAGWAGRLGLPRPADCAVSTTALHWLTPPALRTMYAEVATALRPGGLLLDGDHFARDTVTAPTLARLERSLTQRMETRGRSDGQPDEWKAWWQAATADPALAGPAAERERRGLTEDHHGSESVQLAQHVTALEAAGFTEIGIIWQHGENRILAAVRGR